MQRLLNTLKSAARPILGPIWRRVRPRMHRIFGMRTELDSLSAGWHQHVPALVNAAASVGAVAREQARMKREHEGALSELKAAIEQLRSELRGGAASTPVRIIDGDKVERARAAGLRLHLGGSRTPPDGYVNVDLREAPGVDVVAPVDALPFGPAEVGEISLSHVLERFTQEEFERRLLPYWAGLLKPGGTFRAVGLDAKAMIAAAARGECPFEDFRQAVLGGQPGGRLNLFTAESLAASLRAGGWAEVEVVAEGRPSGAAYELEVVARAAAK